MKIELRFSKF